LEAEELLFHGAKFGTWLKEEKFKVKRNENAVEIQ